MAIIAVAGGTGPVGKTIVEALVANGDYEVYVLSQKARPSENGIKYLHTAYDDVTSMSKTLESVGVQILICAIGVVTPRASAAQINLIHAANASATTKRFVISGFDLPYSPEDIPSGNPLPRHIFEAVDVIESTDLIYTRFANGWFLDYYAVPFRKTYLHPWVSVLEMEQKWAIVPGDGSAKTHFITTQDMALFVARLMAEDRWEKVSPIVTNTIAIKDFVEKAKRIRGSDFQVIHDSLEKLQTGKISRIENFPVIGMGDLDESIYALFHAQAAKGMNNFTPAKEDQLNERFPDIKITTVDEIFAFWEGK